MSILAIIAAVVPTLTSAYTLGSGKTGPAGWLEDQNYHRCMHNADPVYWDDGLAAKAQAWAVHLASINQMVHSKAYNIFPYSGENLAVGYSTMNISMDKWYTEYNMWQCNGDWRNVTGEFGHFTAMVWKGIDRIGCGVSGKYYVCEYGSSKCMTNTGSNAPASCELTTPSNLPNFNSKSSCGSDGKICVDCLNTSNAAKCAAMTTPVYFGGSSTSAAAASTTTANPVATTTTVAPTTSPIVSTTVVQTPSGDVITDSAVNRVMACSASQLQAANQKCKVLGKNSFCQILADAPTCFGYDSTDCSC